jgi:hypothetical protein
MPITPPRLSARRHVGDITAIARDSPRYEAGALDLGPCVSIRQRGANGLAENFRDRPLRRKDRTMINSVEALKTLAQCISDLERRIAVDDECFEHLNKLYSLIWIEACYDPDNEHSARFAAKCLPHIKALNVKLKFKP